MEATAAPLIEIGILTKGKPTLAIVLANLLLQDFDRIRILIMDTGDEPVIKRDDVLFALKLAADRGIRCDYDRSRDRARRFSAGKLRLVEELSGPYLCFMDDDVAMPSNVLSRLAASAFAHQRFGYVAPRCVNAGVRHGFLENRPHYAPGGIIYQDDLVRRILLDYYATTRDVLDPGPDRQNRVWELAFLTELFPALGRPGIVQEDNISYHLDYHQELNWELLEERLLRTTRAKVEELVRKHAPAGAFPSGAG
jgi:hypothetical protein